jgi:hypothetical protein
MQICRFRTKTFRLFDPYLSRTLKRVERYNVELRSDKKQPPLPDTLLQFNRSLEFVYFHFKPLHTKNEQVTPGIELK